MADNMDYHDAPQQTGMHYMMQQIEAMQQQLAEQSARLAATENQALPAQAQHTVTQPSYILPSRRPKLPDPAKFSGDRLRYAAFEEQLLGKLQIDGEFLGAEEVKVTYAFGLLEGDAVEYMRPWMQTMRGTLSFTVENFMKHLKTAYQGPEFTENARQKLQRVQQGDRSVVEYIAEFDKTFLEAQSAGLPDWSKINDVRKGLNKKMGRLLVTAPEPSDYPTWCTLVKTLARKDEAEANRTTGLPRRETQRQPPSSSPTPLNQQELPPKFPQPEAAKAPEVEMTLGATGQRRRAAWVSEEERGRRRKEGLCRRCGGNGHFIKDCPYLPARCPNLNMSTIKTVEPLLEPEEPRESPK